ncbi:MAG: undecaprenyl-phosphate galactose phosphotransferase WbaP [Anaerolineae bacterium]|jgi:Undecaprenyl-phosphate galactose phosphotransferase WbaP|nr:undecaprenyl-phosphate galactose phosphotransferase WbaP [Anaerolineae bacterium]
MEETKYTLQNSPEKLPKGLPTITAHAVMVIGMIVSDMMAIVLSGLLSILMRRFFLGSLPLSAGSWLPVLVGVFVIVYAARGFYPGIGLGLVEELRLLTTTTSLVFISVGAVTYMGGVSIDFSRFTFLLTWFLSIVAVPVVRVLTRHILTRLNLWGEPVAVIGEAKAAERVARSFLENPKIGLKPVFVGRNLREYRDHCPLPKYCPRSAVVLYQKLDQLDLIRDTFRDTFERVILFSSEDEGLQLNGLRVRLFGDQVVFEATHSLLDTNAQFTKRVIDVVVSTLGLVVLSPLLLLFAIILKMDSKGPVFYRQHRIGKNGRPFDMIKFRTMHLNADDVLVSYLSEHPAAKVEWDAYQKLVNDPRVTRVGKLFRRFSIDELPQLWNVLVGEMSLVGPRPFMVNQSQIYGVKMQDYQRVRPGITGLWQISGRNKTTFERRAELDQRYVLSWSVWLDMYILIRTAWVVLIHDGAN